jgi:hypothetical protein
VNAPKATKGAPAPRACQCPNCDWKGHEEELKEAKDLSRRMEPGDTMPDGECPRCGALVCALDALDVKPAEGIDVEDYERLVQFRRAVSEILLDKRGREKELNSCADAVDWISGALRQARANAPASVNPWHLLEELGNAVMHLHDLGGSGGTEADDRVRAALREAAKHVDIPID